MELLIAVGVFGLISGVVYFIVASRAPVSDEVIQRRLENINVKAESSHQFRLHEADETSIWESITNFFMGDQELPERFNAMSRRLHQAGYRGNRAIRIFWGLRIFLMHCFRIWRLVDSVAVQRFDARLHNVSGSGRVVGIYAPGPHRVSQSQRESSGNERNSAGRIGFDRCLRRGGYGC